MFIVLGTSRGTVCSDTKELILGDMGKGAVSEILKKTWDGDSREE